MPFDGFTEKTPAYFLNIGLDNTKSHFGALREDYEKHVKAPLRALHEALVPVMAELGGDICTKPSRCVSGAYNDARFSRSDPVKTYMYLHFRAETGRETDIPGFFMDASRDGYRYGLQLYHPTAAGMTRLRDAVLNEERRFSAIVSALEKRGEFALEGELFKKDRFPSAPPHLKNWLNRKSWWLGRTNPPDNAFYSAGLAAVLTEGYRSLGPLCRFVRDALR